MTRGRTIEDQGRMDEAFRGEPRQTRLLSGWVIDRSSGRPALRLAWHSADTAADAPSARVA